MVRLQSKRIHWHTKYFLDRTHVVLASEWASWMGAYIYPLCVAPFLPTTRLYPQPIRISLHSSVCGGVFCSLLFKKSQNSALLDTACCMFQNIKTRRKSSHVGLFVLWNLTSNSLMDSSNDQNSTHLHHMWVLPVLSHPKDLKSIDSGYGLGICYNP
jgi:hypothetical protein